MYFVIFVFTGKEETTINNITKHIDPNLYDDIFSPCTEKLIKVKKKWVKDTKKMFPGYIFVETNDPKAFSDSLYFIPGFKKLLGNNEDVFYPLTDIETETINKLVNKENDYVVKTSIIKIHEGKQIEIIDGPLKGVSGNVKKIDVHKRVAYVEIEMAGRLCVTQLGVEILAEKE